MPSFDRHQQGRLDRPRGLAGCIKGGRDEDALSPCRDRRVPASVSCQSIGERVIWRLQPVD